MKASTTTNKISTRQSTNKARSVHHKKSSIKQLSQRTTASSNNKDRGSISFNEMCRLMSTYGSTKCLRKRKVSTSSNDNNNGQSTAKIESTKRKFYRWFPNLESRFTRNPTTGRYEPNIGHEAEIQYRLDMRKKDGQVLSKKRAKCRKERNTGVVGVNTAATTSSSAFKAPKIITPSTSTVSDTSSSSSHRISPVVTPHMMNNNMIIPSGIMSSSSSSLPLYNGTTATSNTQAAVNCDDEYLSSSMNFGYVPMPPPSPNKKNSKVSPLIHSNVAPHSTTTTAFDEDPMPDRSFIAERGIFDDVERTFYGVEEDDQQEQEMLLPLSSMIEERGDSSSWSSTSSSLSSSDNRSSPTSSIDEMIDKSIEECCEEIFMEDESLVRGDSAGYLFDIIS